MRISEPSSGAIPRAAQYPGDKSRRASERSEGEERRVGFHVHYRLLADLLEAAATAITEVKGVEPHQVARLKEAAEVWRSLA